MYIVEFFPSTERDQVLFLRIMSFLTVSSCRWTGSCFGSVGVINGWTGISIFGLIWRKTTSYFFHFDLGSDSHGTSRVTADTSTCNTECPDLVSKLSGVAYANFYNEES